MQLRDIQPATRVPQREFLQAEENHRLAGQQQRVDALVDELEQATISSVCEEPICDLDRFCGYEQKTVLSVPAGAHRRTRAARGVNCGRAIG